MRYVVGALILAMGVVGLPLGNVTPAKADDGKQYILLGLGDQLPDNFEDLVASVGGSVVNRDDEIGVAVVKSSDPAFKYAITSIPGVQGLTENRPVAFGPLPEAGVVLDSAEQTGVVPLAVDPSKALLLWAQWNLRVIGAEQAWGAGFMGDPHIKVAVIDTGIDDTQQELVGKVDQTLSRSFIDELGPLPPDVNPRTVKKWVDISGHGTHVAGIIAASGVRVAGVAPHVTLIAVKVAGRSGFAEWGTIIQAIIYAANSGANVINMSFSELFEEDSPGLDQLEDALQRAINYAFRKGVFLVASAGNNSIDWDRASNIVRLPAQMEHVVGVSATGPTFGVNPDALAAYSDFGKEIVTFAAPGGTCADYDPMKGGRCLGNPTKLIPPDPVLSACSSFLYKPDERLPLGDPLNWPCRFAVRNGRVVRIQASLSLWGTSMAAAHVSGVAALAASAAGGSTRPAQILEILKRSADHLGLPGRNASYGFGRINAYRAVLYADQRVAEQTDGIDADLQTINP
jgi:subtilisin family serine protease